MPAVRVRIAKLEADMTPRGWIEGRDPLLIDFVKWFCENAGIHFDVAMVPSGVPGLPLLRRLCDAMSGHSRGLPSQPCECADCVQGLTADRIDQALRLMFVPDGFSRSANV